MKQTSLTERLITIIFLSIMIVSCKQSSPSEDIMQIIASCEEEIYSIKTLEEITERQFNMLDSITGCLDKNHNGYRFVENEDEYEKVMNRFARYNIIYCRALSRFNPELDSNKENNDKLVQVLALMKRMEHQALTAPHGFNPQHSVANTLITIEKSNPQEELNGGIDTPESSAPYTNSQDTGLKIRRSIEGYVIAKSTKQTIIDEFVRSKRSYQVKDNGVTIRSSENIKFGGIEWDEVCYVFINDKLFKVVYTKSGRSKYNEIVSDGNYLRKNLFNKYRNYYIPNSSTSFSDGNTEIFLFENYSKESPGLGIQYFDVVASDEDVDDL